MGARASLDVVVKREKSLLNPCQESDPVLAVCSLVGILAELPQLPSDLTPQGHPICIGMSCILYKSETNVYVYKESMC